MIPFKGTAFLDAVFCRGALRGLTCARQFCGMSALFASFHQTPGSTKFDTVHCLVMLATTELRARSASFWKKARVQSVLNIFDNRSVELLILWFSVFYGGFLLAKGFPDYPSPSWRDLRLTVANVYSTVTCWSIPEFDEGVVHYPVCTPPQGERCGGAKATV